MAYARLNFGCLAETSERPEMWFNRLADVGGEAGVDHALAVLVTDVGGECDGGDGSASLRRALAHLGDQAWPSVSGMPMSQTRTSGAPRSSD